MASYFFNVYFFFILFVDVNLKFQFKELSCIFEAEHFPAVKFAIVYEKNMSKIVIPKSMKV